MKSLQVRKRSFKSLSLLVVVLLYACSVQVQAFTPSPPTTTKTTLSTTTTTSRVSRFFVSSTSLVPKRQTTSPVFSLRARSNNKEYDDDDTMTSRRSGPAVVVNWSLVRQTVLNQGLIGFTLWTGGAGAQALQERAQFDGTAIVLAVAGVVPLIAFSRTVETSESPAVADLNVSTNMLVLRLFGDQTQPIVALVVSAVLAGITGLVEETTFRGQVLPKIASLADDNLVPAVALSTVIFAVLHANPLALLRGGKQGVQDTLVLIAYQLVTGTWFALLFVWTNNLAVPIVTHGLFDFYVFYATHLMVTKQMQYATTQALMPTATRQETQWQQARGTQFIKNARETFYLADTNQDGVLSREELRIALASYGIRLSAQQSQRVLQTADVDDSGTIDYGEFLDFIGPAGSPSKAIKNSLLGVNG